MDEQPKRVLFITPQPFFQWRGSPIRVSFDVRALAESGYEVDLLAMPVGEDLSIRGVRIYRVANVLKLKSLPIGPSFAKAFMDLFLFLKAVRLARQNRYAVIHGVEEAGVMAVILARRAGARAVFEKHSDPSSYKKGVFRNFIMALYAQVEAFTIRRADAVIGTGPGLVEQAKKVTPTTPAYHIFDIPSSLVEADPDRVSAVRASLQQAEDELLVTYVGSFAVYQGIDLMFEGMSPALLKEPRLRFVVIGGSPKQIAEREARLETQGVAGRVTFAGTVPPDELPAYLSASDILLSPRIAGNNTPLKLLDYLKAGRAILATDHEANRLILDEQNSLLFTPTPEAFAKGLLRLAGDPALRERLAEQGKAMIRDLYNYGEFKRRLAACYAELDPPGGQ